MQAEGDAKYLKRKIRSGAIDVHPTEQALVVNYELEALILGDLGDPLLGDRKECQKIIRLQSLNADTDCAALAKQVVDQCSLIHSTKLEEVEHLIHYLRNRRSELAPTGNGTLSAESSESPRPSSSSSNSSWNSPDKASITNIEEYNELLYEDITQKVQGSSLILDLARNPDNLYDLGNNESVLSALARVLREDWKQSIELATNIVYTFFCFSKFDDFHNIILQYKVGSQCMEIIDSELRRFDQVKAEVGPRGASAVRRGTSAAKKAGGDGAVSLIPVTRGDAARRRASDTAGNGKHDEPNEDCHARRQKFEHFTQKQDKLLRVSFYLLMNIAQNTKVEDKMRRKNIVGMLAKTLERDNPDLLNLVVSFLRKLSLFRENVDDMRDFNVVEMLPRLLAIDNVELTDHTLCLLFNLSFDTDVRERMVRVGFLPKLVSLMSNHDHIETVLKLLYHLSMDDRCKSMFVYTDCVAVAMDMLLAGDPDELSDELVALAINLAVNKRNAEMMIENDRLPAIMERAFHNQNLLVMKMIRNIAQHDTTKVHFIEFVGDIAKAIVESEDTEFVVECVGVLGNMTIPDLDFCEIMRQFKLVPWIINVLVSDKHEDDLVLDLLVLLGTAAADQGCAELLCKADVLLTLIDLLKAKQEDDEIVLQIIYVFYQVTLHATTQDYVITQTEAPAYLIDLMHDKNVYISKMCKACLDAIAENNEKWSERITLAKFRWHNSQWLEMVESNISENILGDFPDDELPNYQNDLLDNSILCMSHSDVRSARLAGNLSSRNYSDLEEDMKNRADLSPRSSEEEDLVLGPRLALSDDGNSD